MGHPGLHRGRVARISLSMSAYDHARSQQSTVSRWHDVSKDGARMDELGSMIKARDVVCSPKGRRPRRGRGDWVCYQRCGADA